MNHELSNLEPFRQLEALREFYTTCQLVNQDFSPLFELKKLERIRLIGLRNYVTTDDELKVLAKRCGKKVNIEVLGRGRKEQTVILKFSV